MILWGEAYRDWRLDQVWPEKRGVHITSAASALPELIKFSKKDLEEFQRLKDEHNSKSHIQHHREAQARWDKEI